MATTISTNSPKLTANIADHADVYGGRGLVFDGVVDFLTLGNSSIFNHSGNYSISVWIKKIGQPDGNRDTNDNPTIIAKGNVYFTLFVNYDGMLGTFFYNNSNANDYNIKTADGVIKLNVWHHVVLTWNNTSSQLYVDGKQEYSGSYTPYNLNTGVNGTEIRIGDKESPSSDSRWHGNMCDMKIFDSHLTEAQVTELYKKPENTPSAVQDNLVAWYPMIEGNPESPQSIVYDHSEKKLGSNLVDNNTSSGWFDNSDGSTITNITDGVSVADDSGFSDIGFFRDSGILSTDLTVGKLYKVQVDAYHNGVATIELRIRDGASNQLINLTTTNTTYTRYIVAQSATAGSIRTNNHASGSIAYLTNLSIKEVLMGNHATTNFFGDDLQTGTWNNSDLVGFTGASADGFTAVNTDASVGNDDNAYGDEISFVAGKTYQLSFTNTVNSGTMGSILVGVTSGTTGSADNIMAYSLFTTTGNYSYTFTPTSTVTRRPSFRFVVNGAYNFTISNFAVKEVGISSSGFDTAVNEPVVPQVPLMRYNQTMLFDGTDDVVDCGDVNGINGTTKLTINAWMKRSQSDSVVTVGKTQNSNYRVSINLFNDGKVYANLATGSGSAFGGVNLTGTDWNFISYVFDGTLSGNAFRLKLYVNGVKKNLSYTGTIPSSVPANTGTFRMGKDISNNIFSEGCIKDVSVFDEAFSVSEVQEIFNDGVAYDATTHSKADDHLLGYWRNDGVTTWTDRGDIQAIGFDDSDDYIDLNNDLESWVESPNKSFSIWVKNKGDGSPSRIFNVGYSESNNTAFGIGLADSTANKPFYFLRDTSAGVLKAEFGDVLNTTDWYHFFIAIDGTANEAYIYQNNVLKVTVSNVGEPAQTTNQTAKIGKHWASDSAHYFNGQISQVAIWDRKLSSTEVSEIYAFGRRTDLTTSYSSNLQGYWLLNPTHSNPDLTGSNKILDRSGNNIHGTQNGGVNFLGTNDGTVSGSPDSITIREGLNANRDGLGFYFTNSSNNVVRFNGVSDYLDLGVFDKNTWKKSFTISFWMKPLDGQPSDVNSIIGVKDGTGADSKFTIQLRTDGKIKIVMNYEGTVKQPQTNSAVYADKESTWKFISIVQDVDNEDIFFYVDNSLVASNGTDVLNGVDVGSIEIERALYIGAENKSNTEIERYYNGLLDEIRIYNRAISLAEHQKNYKHQKGKHKND